MDHGKKVVIPKLIGLPFIAMAHFFKRRQSPPDNIDHICITKGWDTVMKIGAWDHFTETAIYMSDHNGVFVDIAKPPTIDD